MHPVLRKAAVVWWAVVTVMIILAWMVLGRVMYRYSPGLMAAVIGVILVAGVTHEYRGKKKEQAKARALSDVQDAITARAAVQGDEVRAARALHDAIRNAVLLDALPDEVDISLDNLNQLKKAIRAERAAAGRRAGDHEANLWRIVWGLAWAATFATLLTIATW